MPTDVSNVGSLDVQDHDGVTLGLKLAGVLVLPTAAQLNDQIGSQVIPGDGAVTIKAGVCVLTKGSAAAITLAAPTSGTDDFKRLTIISATAFAHTVTQTSPGFDGGGAASDVGTYTAAKGNNIVAIAYQGTWYVQSLRNVTLA